MEYVLLIKVGKIVAGGVFGYLYYRFIGCSSGACPLTSNPVTSVLYGALIGLSFAYSS